MVVTQVHKHALLAAVQLAAITMQTTISGTFSNQHTPECVRAVWQLEHNSSVTGHELPVMCLTARQFPGHFGPSIFIMMFGVSALCYGHWGLARRCRFEGKAALGASSSYLMFEFVIALFTGQGSLLVHYTKHGLHTWMMAIVGACGGLFLLAPRLERRAAARLGVLPHFVFSMAFSLFIYQHKQPNDFGVAMHNGAILWMCAAGVLRLAGCVHESGAAYVIAAYTFFGGQTGYTVDAERRGVDVGGYVLLWTFCAFCLVIAYVSAFLRADAKDQVRDDDYGHLPSCDVDERDAAGAALGSAGGAIAMEELGGKRRNTPGHDA